LHGRPLDTLRLHLSAERRVLILSEDGGTPSAIAELLTKLGWGPSRITVFAHLQGSNETVFGQEARFWGDRRAPDLNTIALACRPGPGARALPALAGLPDEVFEHDGQLTKREVRAATLAALSPLPGEVLWDIGAGCGSISIEWLRAGDGRSAIAIERDPARAALIARNAVSLGVPALRVVIGAAPEALGNLPQPDAVFIGGGSGEPGLLQQTWAALPAGGRFVANVVTTEGEVRLLDWHAKYGGALTRIAVSRAEPRGPHHLWRPLATVTQLASVKPA
jgi:precorrin-6Y C5,15-methyltransferase (decarboxylating)